MKMMMYEGITKYKKITIEENGCEIARCYLYFIDNDLHDEKYALIEDVYVNEKYRGKGIGTKIVKEAIRIASNEGCYKIILTSRFEKDRVHNWYKKLGFMLWGYEFRIDLVKK